MSSDFQEVLQLEPGKDIMRIAKEDGRQVVVEIAELSGEGAGPAEKPPCHCYHPR